MRSTLWSAFGLLVLCSLTPNVGSAQGAQPTVDLTRSNVLAPLAGMMSTRAWYQTNIQFGGTDMGFNFGHNGILWIPFGDTSKGPAIDHISAPGNAWQGDDALGAICLQPLNCPALVPWFTTGDDVDNYVNTHPPSAGERSWQREAPPVVFHTYTSGSLTNLLPIRVRRGGVTDLNMVPPIPGPGFSNNKPGAFNAAYVLFNGPIARCPCSPGFVCKNDIGVTDLDGQTDPLKVFGKFPCEKSTAGCAAVTGVCWDPTAPTQGPPHTFEYLAQSARRLEIGNADPTAPARFYSQAWDSEKFINPAMATVNNFSPLRSIFGPIPNDYRPPIGGTTDFQRVFLWGRAGARARMYFAYIDMPLYSPTGSFLWRPNFYTGTDALGFPHFSTREVDAQALVLNAANGSQDEFWAVVQMFSVRWIDSLGKWAMIYGGGETPPIIPMGAVDDPQHAIHIRFASHPWGPWSDPQQFFISGDPAVAPSGYAPATQFGRNGILFHPQCRNFWSDLECAPTEAWGLGHAGFLYGVNIIDQWNSVRLLPRLGVDIYWTVSTWNPYQVLLMKTRVNNP